MKMQGNVIQKDVIGILWLEIQCLILWILFIHLNNTWISVCESLQSFKFHLQQTKEKKTEQNKMNKAKHQFVSRCFSLISFKPGTIIVTTKHH